MRSSTRLSLLTILGLTALGGRMNAAERSEFAAGRVYYAEGEFKRAATFFQRAIEGRPDDAEAYYWAGLSFERLADIATPFGGRYNSKALDCLAKAVKLAPGRADYRKTLFDLLLDEDNASPAKLRQAADMLETMPHSDPEF